MPYFQKGPSPANSVPQPVLHKALVPGGSCLSTPPFCSIGLPNIAAVATAGQDTTAPSVSPGLGSEGQELIIGPWAKPRACLPAHGALPPSSPRTTRLEHLVPVSTVGRGRGLRVVFGLPRTELSVCGLGWQGRDGTQGSDCPLSTASPCLSSSHCTDEETEARRSQDQPGSQDHQESPASFLATPSHLSSLGLCLREAGHTLLVAEQPCLEVLLGVRPSPEVPGVWGGAEVPLPWALVAASCHL